MEAFSRIGADPPPPGESEPAPRVPFLPVMPDGPATPAAPRVVIGLLSLSIMELNWPDGIVDPRVRWDTGVMFEDGALPDIGV